MYREIKFRGKHDSSSPWIYGCKIVIDGIKPFYVEEFLG